MLLDYLITPEQDNIVTHERVDDIPFVRHESEDECPF